MLQSWTLALKNEKSHGSKLNKAYVTILLTANMGGSSKLCPLVIGKFKSPIRLQGCTSLPVTCHSNSKAWMTRTLFEAWLGRWVCVEQTQGLPVAGQLFSSPRNIELCFLPLSMMAVLQPLDQSIIHAFKFGYRKCVVERLVLQWQTNEELKINLFRAIQLISSAWQDATRNKIWNCFRHSGLCRTGAEAVHVP